MKWDSLTMNREDKYENVLRKEKIQEYEREAKLQSIMERMKKIDEMKYIIILIGRSQRYAISQEKRKMQDEMERKKQDMMKKFEKIMKKGRLNKAKFYAEIFKDQGYKTDSKSYFNSGPFMSQELNNTDNGDSRTIEDIREVKPKAHEKINNTISYEVERSKEESKANNETSLKENKIASPVQSPRREESKEVQHLTEEQIESKLREKKAELEHNMYDKMTKFQIKENKMLEEIKEIQDEEERVTKEEDYSQEKLNNQHHLDEMKE